ncbi:MAG: thioredoxin [Ruminococcaceae bacterium]|nr:thioredoxin [Oscillospiraceae bacterium]
MANNVIEITTQNFENEVLKADVPVLVDFWASWCGPCKMVSPIIDELADDFEGRAKVGKINVDEQMELAEKFKVMTIPTVMIFKNGEMVQKSVGAKPKSEFAQMIENNI